MSPETTLVSLVSSVCFSGCHITPTIGNFLWKNTSIVSSDNRQRTTPARSEVTFDADNSSVDTSPHSISMPSPSNVGHEIKKKSDKNCDNLAIGQIPTDFSHLSKDTEESIDNLPSTSILLDAADRHSVTSSSVESSITSASVASSSAVTDTCSERSVGNRKRCKRTN